MFPHLSSFFRNLTFIQPWRISTIRLVLISTLVLSLIALLYVNRFLLENNSANKTTSSSIRENLVCKNMSKNWIVLTTIFYPTVAVELFLSLDEWMLVVIADRKTPLDWLSRVRPSLRQKLVYLSLSDQKRLNYGIVRFLPEGSYARKNIGYLVAIQCGAQVIFESDDDNFLENKSLKVLPKISPLDIIPNIAFHGERSSFINIYGSFGHPNLWPRGFPLEQLKNVSEDGWSSLRWNGEDIHAYIQQYLADLHPDVDAIYRLTNPFNLGHIEFNREQTPIALEPFTFSPYNTQNTITYYEAFWGLFLPVTTSFRVCDIWRGFWVQRLLWDIGGRLVFAGPTVKQKRNVHNFLHDMKEEQQMYYESAAFVRFLASWKSTSTSLFENIRSLANDIVKRGFWNSAEEKYLDIWLKDLLDLGYQPPPLIHSTNKKPNRSKQKRTAICVTGRLTCVAESWFLFEKQLRQRLKSPIDIFYYLSSSIPIKPCKCFNMTLLTNATVSVLHAERNLYYHQWKRSCLIGSSSLENLTEDKFEDMWSQAKCYDLVTSYQKQNNLKYQLFVHVQFDSTFIKMPIFDERYSPLNTNSTTSLSDDNYTDQFSIGPFKKMSNYMRRWYTLHNCSMNLYKQLISTFNLYTSMSFDNETIFYRNKSDRC